MAHLTIKNIGPISFIDLELNKINVFIGPQSSGKSTVAKIIAFCQWLEKDCIVRQSTSYTDRTLINKCLISYFNLSDYFTRDSYFLYEGRSLIIEYDTEDVSIQKNEGFSEYDISKNAYIPSERNILSVPGIFNAKMPNNYLLEFIDDWQIIRTAYRAGSGLRLLNLGGSYYFEDSDKEDMLKLGNGKGIHMSQASSGVQSAVPLCVCIDYLTSWIYNNDEDNSADGRQRLRESIIRRAILDIHNEDDSYLDSILQAIESTSAEDFVAKFDDMANAVKNGDDLSDFKVSKDEAVIMKVLLKALVYRKSLNRIKFTNLVVEEPEQNLFPQTQVALVYFMLSKINHSRDNLVITTHSPYILYALNNCMLADMVGNEKLEEYKDLISVMPEATIPASHVSVWEISEGTIRNESTIQDSRGLILDNYFDRVMKNVMANFHNLLNFC